MFEKWERKKKEEKPPGEVLLKLKGKPPGELIKRQVALLLMAWGGA